MPVPRDARETRTGAADAVERLYVLWIVSTLLLLFVIVVLAFFVTGKLGAQARVITGLGERVAALETARLQDDAQRAAPRSAERRAVPPAPASRPAATTRPSGSLPAAPRPSSGATGAARLNDAAIAERFAAATQVDGELPYELKDAAAGAALVREADALTAQELRGESWSKLAILALLLSLPQPAARFGGWARERGDSGGALTDLAARLALRDRQSAAALSHARELAAHDAGAATVIGAAAAVQLGQLEQARAAVADVADPARLSVRDRLLLGEVFANLEQWTALDALLDQIGEVPEEVGARRDYLRARRLIQAGQLAEALAILDFLRESRPNDPDLLTWRGVALLRGGQLVAARAVLATAAEHARDQPAPWYWRGVLELSDGATDEAALFFQKALDQAPRFAPALEALATLALNGGETAAALAYLERALAAEPGRATAHFLMALAHAKASRRDDAADALRVALRADPTLLETARASEVLRRLFEPDELELLLPTAATQPTEEAVVREEEPT